MRALAQSRLPTQRTGLFFPSIHNLSLYHSHLSKAHTLLNVCGATFPLTMSSGKPPDAARKKLSNTAWSALRQNNWEKALKIIPYIDFALEDIHHFKLLCCTYLQAQEWETLSVIASVATEHFPAEPLFWETWSWAEYVQGHPGTALRILESVIPDFCHREATACILAYLYASQDMPSEAAHWIEFAAQLSSEARARRSESSMRIIPPKNHIYFPTESQISE